MSDRETRGECRCGRLRLALRGRPLITMACHCTGCQKMTASAFSLSALYAAKAIRIEEGETAIGGLHGGHRHHFCAHCLTWAFTRPEGMDDFVNLRTSMLGDAARWTPFIETCTAEKPPWAHVPATHSFEHFPDPAQFPSLLAAFAAQNP